jgi:hypothetical protein
MCSENTLENMIETCLLKPKFVLGPTKHDKNMKIDPR